MNRVSTSLIAAILILALACPAVMAGGPLVRKKPKVVKDFIFVATAKNFRGALYIGYGPTAAHAAEMAIVKCSQDSVIPMSCEVCKMRKELASGDGVALPPMAKKKYSKTSKLPEPPGFPWRKPMP